MTSISMTSEMILLGDRLQEAENRIRELLQDREILHQDGERWREYGKAAIKTRLEAMRLLKIYREHVPLGHQPHMLAAEVDKFISENV